MSFVDLIVTLIADSLAGINAWLSSYVNMPANATGPLDPNITLTPLGTDFVLQMARAAIAWSGTIAGTLDRLVPH
jgi:hypothetical protein